LLIITIKEQSVILFHWICFFHLALFTIVDSLSTGHFKCKWCCKNFYCIYLKYCSYCQWLWIYYNIYLWFWKCVKVGESLETESSLLGTYSPILLVQGQVGGEVTSVKVASETKLLEAGSTIVEGLDRLFKTYWLCGMGISGQLF